MSALEILRHFAGLCLLAAGPGIQAEPAAEIAATGGIAPAVSSACAACGHKPLLTLDAPHNPRLPMDSQSAIDEIVRIRQSLNLNPLKGSLLESFEATNDFEQALFREITGASAELPHAGRVGCTIDVCEAHAPCAAEQCLNGGEEECRVWRAHVGCRGAQPIDAPYPASAMVGTLRQAARELDMLAADCEEELNYGRADHLRELGNRLRHEARGLPQHPAGEFSSAALRERSEQGVFSFSIGFDR